MSFWWNKPAVKYRGLVNHGATCYLNSVLQVLFMTEEFRGAVTSPSVADIDHLLKELFEELQKGTLSADPYNILRALEVSNVCEQQDAAEYFERILRKTSGNAATIFHGRLSHRTKCLNCKVQTDSEGPFWHLPLELEDSPGGNYSVENGINQFFTQTIFNGDNQIYCDECDAKVDATREYVITRHPDVLLLMLKRFDFSYQWMSYIKIHCIADVPHTIRIPESQIYELYAVVEHSGDLRGGHYRAVIKSKDEGDDWFVFDDRSVMKLGINPFPDNVNVVQSRDAYLLFYRKKVADIPISDPCSVRDYNPNIIQDQSPKEENLQPGDETETLKENISNKKRKIDDISTEATSEIMNPEKRAIYESEEIDPDKDRLPEEQTGREKETEGLRHNETQYPQDITMEDEEEQEETAEDQIQGLVGEPEPMNVGNMQTDMNYDVESSGPAALERQENLWEQQGSAEDRTDEVKRKQETENSNKLIRTSEEAGADENNKLLPTGNMSYNHNEAERAAENEQIGEEASRSTENLSPQDPDSKVFSKISQCLLNPDEPNIDDNHQRRNELTDDASKTQTQEPEDVEETRVHKERPEVDEGGESKQKDEQSQIRNRNRSDQGKEENKDNTDRTGEDQVAAYSDRPQPYHDESEEVIKKKHTKQKVHTSHDTQNELDLKKNRKNKNYKLAATLTGNQEADRDEETRQENFQSYRNKGSKVTEARIQGSNQAAFERKTIEVDVREFSPGGKGKTKLMIKTITEEIKVVNSSSNRKTTSHEGNVDCDLEDGVLLSAKGETTVLSEPLLREQQNPTSKEITRGAKQDEFRLKISPQTDLEAQQQRHEMKRKRSCRCSCVIL
ncbi:ubiquitin carboxyl-terminal hydrolase 17-like protein C isoform X1 [Xiphophorus hellerii]|uniref:ubiquitin carboxyl-terminal hydrolase 17-like protein C isoform X1 n=2 Tax=Xiphophorus hellerii TaxID=8084 RepID=UPI0013B3A4C7|nr:ubiquitin carboxyl-terminal hydrolase 17-like protein C isoform X1 [Xiphophorus hellerii]